MMAPVPGMRPLPGKKKPTNVKARPDAFGDATKFEDDRRQWAQDHPDNKGGKVPAYTPPPSKDNKSIGKSIGKLIGSTSVRGMVR